MSTQIDPTPSTSPPMSPAGASDRAGACVLVAGGVTLLAGLLVVPGPDIADVHAATWVPGHALNAVGFLLLALGVPSLIPSFRSRLGVLGGIGYLALMARLVLSTGSHLYSMWIMPTLDRHRELHDSLQHTKSLGTLYAGHGPGIGVGVAVGLVCLAVALWREGRGLRTAAVTMLLAGLAEAIGVPLALLVFAGLAIWLGLRLAVRGDATVPLHRPTASA